MLIISVQLRSAITGETTELARMHISNDATGTAAAGNYDATTFTGRSRLALNALRVARRGRVEKYPRQRLHVWNLVARALAATGYG